MAPITIEDKKNHEILFHAAKLMRINELLIKQCDSWLSAEEGNRNMMREIRERGKTKMTKMTKIDKMTKMAKIKAALRRMFGIDWIFGKNKNN